MILKIVMLFCNYLEYKKFLLIIDKKKYDKSNKINISKLLKTINNKLSLL